MNYNAIINENMSHKTNPNVHSIFPLCVCRSIVAVEQTKKQVILYNVTPDDILTSVARDCRFGSKVGQIGPKWYKSETFSDQISVHLNFGASRPKCTDICSEKVLDFIPFGANLTHFGP